MSRATLLLTSGGFIRVAFFLVGLGDCEPAPDQGRFGTWS
jgi:hypothetical protein